MWERKRENNKERKATQKKGWTRRSKSEVSWRKKHRTQGSNDYLKDINKNTNI